MIQKRTTWPALFIGAAGIIHIVITPQHWAHAPAHGLLFLVVGIAEILWSIAAWRRPSPSVYRMGMLLAGWLIILWAITRVLPAPFGHGPEPIEPFGIVCKLAEGLGVVVIGLLIFGETVSRAGPLAAWRGLALLAAGALVAGFATYGAARAAEPMLPWLGVSAEAHSHDHGAVSEPAHEHEHEMAATPAHEHPHEATPSPVHEHPHEMTPTHEHPHEATPSPAHEHPHEMTPTPTHEHSHEGTPAHEHSHEATATPSQGSDY